jgi:hypothetical protein
MSDFIKAQKAKTYATSLLHSSISIHGEILYAEASDLTSLFRIVLVGGNSIDLYMGSQDLSAKLAAAFNAILEQEFRPAPMVPLAEAIDDDIPF